MKLFAIILLLCKVYSSFGFAMWMTSDFCDRPIVEGEIIMNEAVEVSDERTIKVFRYEKEEIFSGDEYFPGEKLTIRISNKDNQYVIEVSDGKIGQGGCNGKRIADKPAVFYYPPSDPNASDVSIIAAWAEGHSVVKMSKPFILKPNLSGEAPPLKTISESEDKFNRRHRARGYQPGQLKVVPDKPSEKPKAKTPSNGEFIPQVRGFSSIIEQHKKRTAPLDAEESNLRGKATSEHIDSNIGVPPHEGREARKTPIDPALANAKIASEFRRGVGYRPKYETPAATNANVVKFSYIDHIFTMNELEFGIIVFILLFFVSSLLYQMYTGRYQVPVFLRFWFKRPGSRYNN